MRRFLTPFRVAVLVVLLVMTTGTTYAATGGHFVLGKANKAKTPSVLANDGKGPALRLKTKRSTPNLSVSNKVKIKRLNADLLDGLTAADLQRRISGSCPAGQAVTSVSAGGQVACAPTGLARSTVVNATGTPDANGAALLAAVAAVPATSAEAPWLVQLGPGTYHLGATGLLLPAYVHLQGSGVGITVISGDHDNGGDNLIRANHGVVVSDLTARVTTGFGVVYGAEGASILQDARLEGGSAGLLTSTNGSLVATNVRLAGNRLVSHYGSITFRDGDTGLAVQTGSFLGHASTNIIDSTVRQVSTNTSYPFTLRCVNAFDEDFAPVSNTCS